MTAWTSRPVEVANLLNPAFCSVLIFEAANSYQQEQNASFPFSLSFLVLPIILHESTREKLPRSIMTKMHSWIRNNPELRIGFAERARQMVPYTRESLLFGISTSVLLLNNQTGDIDVDPKKLGKRTWQTGTEESACIRKSVLLGKWFAQTGDATIIYGMWGIQP